MNLEPCRKLAHGRCVTPEETIARLEDLLARRERWGFSYVIVGEEDVDGFAPVVAELAGR